MPRSPALAGGASAALLEAFCGRVGALSSRSLSAAARRMAAPERPPTAAASQPPSAARPPPQEPGAAVASAAPAPVPTAAAPAAAPARPAPAEEEDPLLAPLPGEESLDERYTSEEVIGEGTYGKVWRGRDRRDSSIVVAIKQVKLLARREQEGFPQQAIREIRALHRIRHPNVVRLVDVCTARASASDVVRTAYLILEYVPNDLAGFHRYRKRKLKLEEVKCLSWQLACGLHHCHKNKIIHRDLKPSNLLLSAQGELKICDFGLSRDFPSKTGHYSTNVITLWYRPPELLLLANDYDESVDIWSAGCIVGELLTGSPLFPESTDIGVFRKIFKRCPEENKLQVWPNKLRELPRWAKFEPERQPNDGENLWWTLRTKVPNSTAVDLVQRMMALDWRLRVTAEGVLKHSFFEESPRRCEPSGIKVNLHLTCNELSLKQPQQPQEQQQAAQARPQVAPGQGQEARRAAARRPAPAALTAGAAAPAAAVKGVGDAAGHHHHHLARMDSSLLTHEEPPSKRRAVLGAAAAAAGPSLP